MRAGVLGAEVDEEILLLVPDGSEYAALCPVGQQIWRLLEAPLTPAELAARLTAAFEATQAQILADILPFLEDMRAKGLIEPA